MFEMKTNEILGVACLDVEGVETILNILGLDCSYLYEEERDGFPPAHQLDDLRFWTLVEIEDWARGFVETLSAKPDA